MLDSLENGAARCRALGTAVCSLIFLLRACAQALSHADFHRRRPWGRSPIISSTAKGSFALLQLRERSVFKSIFFKGAGACMHTETNGSQHRETNLRSKILGSPHRKMADGSCRVERAAGSSRGESRSPRSLAAGSVCEQQSGGAAHVLFGDWGYRHAIADRFSRQGGRNRAAEEKPRSKLRPRLPNLASLQARWSRGASFPSSRARPCLGPGRLRRCL